MVTNTLKCLSWGAHLNTTTVFPYISAVSHYDMLATIWGRGSLTSVILSILLGCFFSVDVTRGM